jgi:hypothetical protein
MSALETSIESLTAEHTTLTQKLEQIDQQYRVERPVVVSQISQLAKALSALTGKAVAGPGGHTGRKPMSEEGKAAIKAGLERARAAKQSGMASQGDLAPVQKTAESPTAQPKPVASAGTPPKKDAASEKAAANR